MKNPNFWLFALVFAAIVGITPFIPEGNYRWIPLVVALLFAGVTAYRSRNANLNNR
jgi:hypothetical protein